MRKFENFVENCGKFFRCLVKMVGGAVRWIIVLGRRTNRQKYSISQVTLENKTVVYTFYVYFAARQMFAIRKTLLIKFCAREFFNDDEHTCCFIILLVGPKLSCCVYQIKLMPQYIHPFSARMA